MHPHYLTHLFRPRSVAVFGASERSDAVGAVLLRNLLEGGFKGSVYPITPKYDSVQGVKAHSSLTTVTERVDLAVIATPAATVPTIMRDLGANGTRAALVVSAGFREIGEAGKRLEDEVLALARQFGIRLVGPNSLGAIRPDIGLNATTSKTRPKPGHVALVSQSGALCTAILDWAATNAVGFSSVISTGNSADIEFGEILDFLVADPKTRSIILYIEGVHNARRFMSGLRAAARVKPVIVMKTGRHMEGSRAVLSHTGALVGDDAVFDAAFCRAGVVRVLNFANLFGAARTLSSRLRTQGGRLAIVTNGGGTGVLAADRLADQGLPVIPLSPTSIEALNRALPSAWSHSNPVDIMGDATPERFRTAVSICMDDRNVDAVLAILTPQALTTQPEAVAQELVLLKKRYTKPLLTCWMGEAQVASSRQLFTEHDVPSYRTPEAAVDAFHLVVAFHRNQQLLLQVPQPLAKEERPDLDRARSIIDGAFAEERTLLSEGESKDLLTAFHIETPRHACVRSVGEALESADAIGFPVALKIDSPHISHKSCVGGVYLDVATMEDVRSGYHAMVDRVREAHPNARIDGVVVEKMFQRPDGRELKVGVVQGPVFGPSIYLGCGGAKPTRLVKRAIALPPLNQYLAQSFIRGAPAYKALFQQGEHATPGVQALEDLLLRVSEMVCELPQLKAMDFDPVVVDEQAGVVVDVRIAIEHRPSSEQPFAHMAIHPYPDQFVRTHRTPDGIDVTIRPIRPEDAIIEHQFVHALSSQSKYFRFMYAVQDLTPAMLSRLTQIDYDREMALIAVAEIEGVEKEIGVARYVINPDGKTCEFAIVVADEWQGKSIASRLMKSLMDIARRKRLQLMEGEVLRENQPMLAFMEALGFSIRRSKEDLEIMHVTKTL